MANVPRFVVRATFVNGPKIQEIFATETLADTKVSDIKAETGNFHILGGVELFLANLVCVQKLDQSYDDGA